MRNDIATRANNLACSRCGYQPDPKRTVNYCPRCGEDLRKRMGQPEAEGSSTSMWIGQVIADRYRLLQLLGEGGMGAVFKAEHIRMGKALAVKVLRGGFARDPAAVARFRAEAQIVSRLSHPHTIAVFDFGDVGNAGFYLAMEYVPGKDLAALLDEHGTIGESRAIDLADQVLGSLAEAHEMGVVHRDVKPANIMVMERREGDFVKLLDFGIAKLRDVPGAVPAQGAILGTPSYLAPEQARGAEADGRADLYAVGAVLYELVAGHPPFQGPPHVVRAAHIHEEPRDLTQVARVSTFFAEVVHRALEKRPENRFPTAEAMREALRAVQRHLPEASRVASAAAAPLPPPAAAPGAGTGAGTGTGTGAGLRPRRSRREMLSLELANRDDFAALADGRAPLRRSGLAWPAAIAMAVAGLLAGGVVWRWGEVHASLERHAPGLAALLPAPRDPLEGEGQEQEPNDTPAAANALPLPPPGVTPAADGRGPGAARGRLGNGEDPRRPDVDVYRIDVPAGGPYVLTARLGAAGAPDEGLRNLGAELVLHRAPPGGETTAPLLAQVDRGPGQPVKLTALVHPGVFFLSVREQRPAGAAARPEAYLLRVGVEEPRPGEEVEPDDAPLAVEGRDLGYLAWREVAERNRLGEGARINGETSAEDPDTFAVGPAGPADRPELVLIVPATAQVALTVQLWMPGAQDLATDAQEVRFVEVGEGEPGQVMAIRLPAIPSASAPALVRLRASVGEGRYEIMAVGSGTATGPALRDRVEALAAAGRAAPALELAAAFAAALPRAPARDEVAIAAGALASRLAPELRSDALLDFERAGKLLRHPVFEVLDGRVRYTGAFDLLVDGHGPGAEAARLRAVTAAVPCTADEVSARARAFLERFPRSRSVAQVRLALARAEEDAYFMGGSPAALERARAAYRAAASTGGRAAEEAQDRLRELGKPRPTPPAVPRTRCE